MLLDKFFYPFLQWLHLMYRDKNPYIVCLMCELCSEPFELFESIVLPLECTSRNGDVKPHYFHGCCAEILGLENDKGNSKYKKQHTRFEPYSECIACSIIKQSEADE